MNYRRNAKTRRLRAKILWLINLVKFKMSVLRLPNQLVVVWAIMSFSALFMPWIKSAWIDESFIDNAFTYRLGYIGYIVLLLALIIFVLPFSNAKKERLKTSMSLVFRDHNIVVLSSVLILLMSFVSLNFVKWLSYYSNAISYWDWIVVCFIGGIFSLAGWYLLFNEYKRDLKTLYIENNSDIIRDYLEDDRNMKLPF